MDTSVTVAPRNRRLSFDLGTIWALLATAVLASVAFIPTATIPFLYTKVSVLAIGGLITLALYILARLTRGNVIVPPATLLGALWIVPAAYLLSAFFSGAGLSRAFFGTELEPDTLGFVLITAVLASLTALAFRRTGHYRTFFKVGAVLLGLVLVVQLVFIIAGKVAPNFISPTTNLIGSFADLGMLVGLGVALTLLAFRFLTPTKKVRIALFVGIGVGLLVLALVNSAVVWAMVALVSLGLFIEAIMHHRATGAEADLDGVAMLLAENDTEPMSGETHSLAVPLVSLVIALLFLIGGSTIGNALAGAFGANVIDVRPSWQSTLAIGGHTYASSPLFGSGPGTFNEEWLKFRDRSLNDTVFWNIDFTSGIGYIPTSFVTTGIIGALAWLAFLGLFIFFGLRALLFRQPNDAFVRFTSVASFTGALFVFALTIFTVPGPIVITVGFLLAGLFISSLRYSAKAHEWGIVFARSPRVGFVIVFGLTLLLLASVGAAYVVIERYLASVAYSEASVALNSNDLAKADTAVARSILFSPADRTYRLASAVGIAHMAQIAADTKLTPSDAQQQFQTALSSSIEAALTSTRLGPDNYQNWAMLGNVYETVVPLNIEGAYDNAKTAYQKAVDLNPSNPSLPYVLAQLEIAKKNSAGAEEQLVKAINLKHDYTQAIFLLSQLKAEQGKAKEALQAAEAAAYFAPQDPTVLFQVGILRSANGDTPGAIQALARAVDLNPQYANARFFLAVMYATNKQNDLAIAQLEAVSALSPENATAVAPDLAQLRLGKNPFPPSRLGALGIPQTITEPANKPATATPAR
ncbi:MAG: Tfp pilus assembly protein PilF [Parcubacteria group bacterium]|nr:Tfp pilus assembly protein PilF [Parcubacteria group bacterium]